LDIPYKHMGKLTLKKVMEALREKIKPSASKTMWNSNTDFKLVYVPDATDSQQADSQTQPQPKHMHKLKVGVGVRVGGRLRLRVGVDQISSVEDDIDIHLIKGALLVLAGDGEAKKATVVIRSVLCRKSAIFRIVESVGLR
jgi:hypothetical protein